MHCPANEAIAGWSARAHQRDRPVCLPRL